MAKGQRRSNREVKKPKQAKSEKKTGIGTTLIATEPPGSPKPKRRP
ncbi:MAG TPA: hypothetical protein VKQ73_05705 [Stellaceae bacterium]|nr:hypothetical protein [Stellaceae bacterium]